MTTKEGGVTINAADTKSNFARPENFIRGGSSLIAGTRDLIQMQKVIDSELFDNSSQLLLRAGGNSSSRDV